MIAADPPGRTATLQGRIKAVLDAVRAPAGATAPELRQAILTGIAVPQELAGFVDKLSQQSWRITDTDFAKLIAAGFTEAAVFEITVAGALEAASRRHETGLRALGLE